MVLARLNPGSAPWPAQRFWISEKAMVVSHNFPGFHKGGMYSARATYREFAIILNLHDDFIS